MVVGEQKITSYLQKLYSNKISVFVLFLFSFDRTGLLC